MISALVLLGFFCFSAAWLWAFLSAPEAFDCGAKFPHSEGDEP